MDIKNDYDWANIEGSNEIAVIIMPGQSLPEKVIRMTQARVHNGIYQTRTVLIND